MMQNDPHHFIKCTSLGFQYTSLHFQYSETIKWVFHVFAIKVSEMVHF